VENGKIKETTLKENQLDRTWLLEQLKQQGIEDSREAFAVMLDTQGRLFVSRSNYPIKP
jgi:uncharacterized membrane protein YcaP (DUF421 family)